MRPASERFVRYAIKLRWPDHWVTFPLDPIETRLESRRFRAFMTHGARFLVAGHGLQILDDYLDVFLR
jgi:hypothetical protein